MDESVSSTFLLTDVSPKKSAGKPLEFDTLNAPLDLILTEQGKYKLPFGLVFRIWLHHI